jgi:hypothetical protein
MAVKKPNDPTYDFVMSIYMQHVPSQSELTNPFSANKRQRKTKLVTKVAKELPDDLGTWSSRNFVDYFAEQYKLYFSSFYKVTYTSDNSIINVIMEFMNENNLDKNEWTKKFIDWCFVNKDLSLKAKGHFLLQNLPNFLNRYYQDAVYSQPNIKLIDIFDEVEKLVKDGKSKEVYARYGIPSASTYYSTFKNVTSIQLEAGLMKLFETLSNGTKEEQDILSSIFQKSISRSPYILDFELLDWRKRFQTTLSKYKVETWWREQDYPGSPRFNYEKFIKKDGQ